MNYGSHVRTLLQDLKRTDGGHEDGVSLPAYNDASVQAALQDFKLHVQALQDQVLAAKQTSEKPSHNVRPSMMLQNAACQRNKRGLLAYHMVRLQRIQDLYHWQSTDGTLQDDPETLGRRYPNLSPAEAQFLSQYQSIVARYTASAFPEISDLRAHATQPPLAVDRVLCRVVDETPFAGGAVVLESGQTVTLTTGSTHFLLYSDCEEYLRSGALLLLETEEHEG
jgi:GINS complex subunit 1